MTIMKKEYISPEINEIKLQYTLLSGSGSNTQPVMLDDTEGEDGWGEAQSRGNGLFLTD